MRRHTASIAIACATLATALGGAQAASVAQTRATESVDAAGPFVPDEVVIGLRGGGERIVRLGRGARPRKAIGSLVEDPDVRYANRNWIATAAVSPLDRGSSGQLGGWRRDQWNFLGKPGGVRAPRAWKRVSAAGAAGARGVRIAVIDTGIAYVDDPEA
jgi:serine protease